MGASPARGSRDGGEEGSGENGGLKPESSKTGAWRLKHAINNQLLLLGMITTYGSCSDSVSSRLVMGGGALSAALCATHCMYPIWSCSLCPAGSDSMTGGGTRRSATGFRTPAEKLADEEVGVRVRA